MSYASARIYFAFAVTALLALGGCASGPAQPGPVRPAVSRPQAPAIPAAAENRRTARQATAIALEQVGRPYRYGGADPSGFDCSGLVHFSYGQAGIATPRTTGALWRSLAPVRSGALEEGDVLFFDIEGKVSHVGLYLGNGRFVHAPSSGRNVTVARLDQPYYRRAFVRGGRP